MSLEQVNRSLAVAEEVVDMTGGRPEYRIAGSRGCGGHRSPEAVANIAFTMSQSSLKLIYSNFIGTM